MSMTESQARAALATLLALPNAAASKAAIIAIDQAAGGDPASYVVGDPSERWLDIAGRAMGAWNVVPGQAVRAQFFALSTDPGDVDDSGVPDQSADQTPRPGFLSAAGLSLCGVERGERTYATSSVSVKNNTASPIGPLLPGAITFEASGIVRDDGGSPTYTTLADANYTGVGGTLTLAPNATATLSVVADQIGSYGSAPAGAINTCVTTGYGVLTVLPGSTTATGFEREARDTYIARCLLEADSRSPGGPGAAYRYAATTGADGAPLQRYDGSGEVNITQVYVSPSSTTGEVTIYYGGPNGTVADVDRDTANANIIGLVLGVVTNPLGVLPDTVALLPYQSGSGEALPSGTPGGASCTAAPVAVTYTAKIRGSKVPGGATAGTYDSGTATGNVAAVFSAIAGAIGDYLLSTGIGGLDQVAGAGSVYPSDIQGAIRDAMEVPQGQTTAVALGLYDVVVSAPSSAAPIALGYIATAGAIAGTLVVV